MGEFKYAKCGVAMLSISPMSGAGQGDYYIELAREDYYLEGGEPSGQWFGDGARELGLEGEVQKQELSNVLRGYSPNGEHQLVQNAGAENRQSGWDLTFSAPKSVSVAWSQSEGEMRKAFQEAHQKAVTKALSYVEDEAGFTRRGQGGVERESAKLTVATFEHGTSRAQDPALHTHALIVNVGVREDGSTGSIESKPIYQQKMAAGAVYRAELAHQIENDGRLGLIAERKQSWFELKGVNQELRDEFSKRRQAVEAELERTGFSGAKAAKVATLNTRNVKEHISRDELFATWKQVGERHNWSTEELTKLAEQKKPERNIEWEKNDAFSTSVTKMTHHQSHFSRRDLVRNVAEEAQGRGLGADDVFSSIEHNLKTRADIVHLGRINGELRYTTKEMLDLEKSMLSKVELSKREHGSNVSEKSLQQAFSKRSSITDEQKTAVRHITQRQGNIQAVSGMAGTGKSYMLGAAKDAYELDGQKVLGAALSGKAAQGLEEGSGIQSDTIHKRLADIEKGRLELKPNTVLVVDEAGMVGTRQMERLVSHTQEAGAKLVLVGDARQLQPVEAGGPFKAIAESVGEAKLTSIRRQDEAWARDAVHKFADGNARAGLEEFAKRGQLQVLDTPIQAKEQLLSDWQKAGVEKPQENLILVGTNSDARALNEKAQLKRFTAGKLGEESIQVGNERLFTGDRVLFTRNSRLHGVRNGQLGTIEALDGPKNSLTAKLDNGQKVKINIGDYEHIKLGYAVTTHKSQGMTAKNTYVLAGGPMQDRELSYVQVSRAKGMTQIYTDKIEAGENLTSLSRQMATSRQKDLAIAVARPETILKGIGL